MKTEGTAFNQDHDHPLKPSAHHESQLSFHLIRGHIIVASILLCPGRGYYYYPCSDSDVQHNKPYQTVSFLFLILTTVL